MALPYRLGVNESPLDYTYTDELMELAQGVGCDLFRADVCWNYSKGSWPGLEMTPGDRNTTCLTDIQNLIALYATYGLKMVFVVDGFLAATYPNATYPDIPCSPAQFAATMAWLAGNCPGQIWELINEPDLSGTGDNNDFTVAISTSTYVSAVQAAYPAMKEADPTCQVNIGVVSDIWVGDTGMDYLEAILPGMEGYCDAISVHMYSYPGTNSPAQGYDGTSMSAAMSNLITYLGENGFSTTPIWLTETGWESNGGSEPTAAEQALYIQQWLVDLTAFSQVAAVCIYQMTDGGGYYGLASGSYVPKQSYQAVLDLLPETNRFYSTSSGSVKRI